MKQDELKQAAAREAIKFIKPNMVIGIGSGSTSHFFIKELSKHKNLIDITVSSSEVSTQLLKKNGIIVKDLNYTSIVDIYIDGADEANNNKQLIKGGGGAQTREKILATVAKEFICIIDESKLVNSLGDYPLPLEVIPMARGHVAREMVKLGGQPILRDGFTTDNGNIILDIHNLKMSNPLQLEENINQIAGVVSNGIFASCSADKLIIANKDGTVTTIK
jgi:ribose 5-phosphate isomerase A